MIVLVSVNRGGCWQIAIEAPRGSRGLAITVDFLRIN
jgi:hypothetical protein